MKTLFNLCILLSGLFTSIAYSNSEHIGIVIKSSGDSFVFRNDTKKIELSRRDKIYEGDRIITELNSTLQIRFIDKAMLALRENSEIIIEQYHATQGQQQEKIFMELLSGGFRTITGNFGKASKDGYEVKTPAASIGIRGTDYEAVLGFDGELSLGVWSGGISVANKSGSIELGSDTGFSFAIVKKNSAPKGSLTPPENLNQKIEKVIEENNEEESSENDKTTEESDESTSNNNDETQESETSDDESSDNSEPTQNDSSESQQNNTTQRSNDEQTDPLAPIATILAPINTSQVNSIEAIINNIIETGINTGNDRLTAEQISQISNDPSVGLIFFSEENRKNIYAPTLQSNVEAQILDFTDCIKPAFLVSNNTWPLINIENGDYVNESITINYLGAVSYIYLHTSSSDDLITVMQQQIDSDLGTGVLTVYLDQSGHLVIESLDSSVNNSFSVDLTEALNFSTDIGLFNATAISEILDNNITFNILIEIDGLSSSYPITLDKEHFTIDDLISDIKEELPANANIIIRPSDNGIEFIVMSTSEESSITITDIQGSDDAANRLKDALGGITADQLSAQSSSGDGQSMHFGYMLKNSNGTLTFITYANEQTDVLQGEYLEPEYILNGGNINNLTQIDNVAGIENISWGYWNNTLEEPAILNSSATSEDGADIQEFSDRYYFIDATPAKTGQLIGQKSFSATGDFLGASSSGDITGLSGHMQVDFSNAHLTGDLTIEVGQTENWQLQYSGQIQGANVKMQNVWGQAILNDSTTADASGDMAGIFVDPGNIYVGGFHIQVVDDSNHYVDGVYMMQEEAINP
ncbi:MAG: FecR domain-containing protein [Saccharospirillaceae bacterium]|nr:FecR family protein [Pseudomonadales bacterium]NRB79662.1 FecR domain-containing protein [Saccharospirillaceae bacterium]